MEGDLDGVILLQVTEATETLFSIPSGCIYLALHFLFLFFLLFFFPLNPFCTWFRCCTFPHFSVHILLWVKDNHIPVNFSENIRKKNAKKYYYFSSFLKKICSGSHTSTLTFVS